MKKVLNVCHIMESFFFTMNIYGRQPYLLDSSVLSKNSPSLLTVMCNLHESSSKMEMMEVELNVHVELDVL